MADMVQQSRRTSSWFSSSASSWHSAPNTTARTAVGGDPSPRITSTRLLNPPSRPCGAPPGLDYKRL